MVSNKKIRPCYFVIEYEYTQVTFKLRDVGEFILHPFFMLFKNTIIYRDIHPKIAIFVMKITQSHEFNFTLETVFVIETV